MTGYILRRIGWALAVLLALAVTTFVLAYVVPADPARMIAGASASAQDVERIRHALGLDQPLLVQLGHYLGRLAVGDLGYSWTEASPVLPRIMAALPATGELAVAALALAMAIGLPLGVFGALRRGTRWDSATTVLTVVFASIPTFLVAYLLLDAAFVLHQANAPLMPVGGGYQPVDPGSVIPPALALGLASAAFYSRIVRATMADELRRDYVRTARAKGAPQRSVVWHHAFHNAIGPVLAQAGLDLGLFLGGVAVVERIFGWPGVGRLAVSAIQSDDVPLIMGTVLVGGLFILLANLAADIAQARLDPRIAM